MASQASTSQPLQAPRRPGAFQSRPSSSPMAQAGAAGVGDEEETELLSVNWNQDYSFFAAATTNGFRVFRCEQFHFHESLTRISPNGGFGIAEMRFRSHVFGLVGDGHHKDFPRNKFMIWDDSQNAKICEFTFNSDIRAAKLSKDHFVIVLECEIHVYRSVNLRLLHRIKTLPNPKGLCCLSHQDTSVMACPGLHPGQVRIEHFGLKATKFISAHQSNISCMALTVDGLLLATASVKGTLIRIYNTMDDTCLQEVRRGLDKAEIYSIALSPNMKWLAVSSAKGTMHIFSLRAGVDGVDASTGQSAIAGPKLDRNDSSASVDPILRTNTGSNTSSSLSFMKRILPKYFSSEWSFAQYHLPEVTRYITAFGDQNTVMMIGMDGSFYRCSFDPVNGGEMVLEEYFRFLKTSKLRSMSPPI